MRWCRSSVAPSTLPTDWLEHLAILNPRYVVPSSCQFLQESWSWYKHAFFPLSSRPFQQPAESALTNAQVVRLKPSVLGMISGAVAGLGTITPASGFVAPWHGIVIGVIVALATYPAQQSWLRHRRDHRHAERGANR